MVGGATRGRLLGVDWGTKRVGLAVSDESGVSARPLPDLQRTSWKQIVKLLADACARYEVRGVVLGIPLQLDGAEGTAAQEIRRVAHNLTLTLNLEVYLEDERLTSLEAEDILRTSGLSEVKIKERVHSQAAAIILQNFLSRPNT